MSLASDYGHDTILSLQRKLKHQNLIHDFAKEVLQHDNIDDILWCICETVISRLDLEDCVIYLLDENNNCLVQKAAYGPKNPNEKEIASQITIDLGEGVVGNVAQTGIAEIIHNTLEDSRYIVDDNFRYSEIAVPIICNDKVIGVIDSEHPEKNFYTSDHLQMLETISSLCSTRIGYAIAHEDLKKHKRQLEQIVENRTEALNGTIEKLRISNLRLERYAHIVSHDLMSPLRTIGAFTQLIGKSETQLGSKSKEYMQLIQEAVIRMSDLLKETLNYSTQKDKFLNTNVDLNQILDKATCNLLYEINKNDVEIVLNNILPDYVCMESHFIQIFQNIISNSIKYKIPNKTQKVIISSFNTDDGILLTFKDMGIGVNAEDLNSIFEFGERRDSNNEGTGIGLDTCADIIKQYGGSINAISEGTNMGLELRIILPIK